MNYFYQYGGGGVGLFAMIQKRMTLFKERVEIWLWNTIETSSPVFTFALGFSKLLL